MGYASGKLKKTKDGKDCLWQGFRISEKLVNHLCDATERSILVIEMTTEA